MQILVDADACPVIETVEKIAKEYCIPVTLLCDTNHDLTSDYSEIFAIKGFHTIGALKTNRMLYPFGIRQKLSGFATLFIGHAC